MKAIYHELERINKKTGRRETVIFTGSLKNKPRGWRVIRKDI